MNTVRQFTARACAGACTLTALVALMGTNVPAAAAAASAVAQTQAQYQRERGRCMKLREQQALDDCLSEASTAYAGSQPAVVDPDPGRYLRNALIRCEPLHEPDRADCVARIKGAGTTSGSVAEGGIYRELVTIETPVAPETPATPATPAPPATPAANLPAPEPTPAPTPPTPEMPK